MSYFLEGKRETVSSFQSVFFIGGVCQTARMEKIVNEEGLLKSGEWTNVEMRYEYFQICGYRRAIINLLGTLIRKRWNRILSRFLYSCEFVRVGTPLIFRQGKITRGMGEVTEVFTQ